MNNILDRVASSNVRRTTMGFEPSTTGDVFALALARRLDDAVAAEHYARLCQQYGREQLLFAYRQTRRSPSPQPLYRVFNENLKNLRAASPPIAQHRLMAIRIERRAVAIAVMRDDHPEWLRVRQLSSHFDKAMDSAAFFTNKVLSQFQVNFAALETIPNGHEYHRSQLSMVITALLRDRIVSITEIGKRAVFASFGHPAKKSRKQVRAVVERIFPFERFSGYGADFAKDALALGLHVQTERLFLNH